MTISTITSLHYLQAQRDLSPLVQPPGLPPEEGGRRQSCPLNSLLALPPGLDSLLGLPPGSQGCGLDSLLPLPSPPNLDSPLITPDFR